MISRSDINLLGLHQKNTLSSIEAIRRDKNFFEEKWFNEWMCIFNPIDQSLMNI